MFVFRYFHYYENMIEWFVLVLVLLSLLPDIWFISDPYLQKHLAAFTFLLAFMQVFFISDLDLQKHSQKHSCSLYACRYSLYQMSEAFSRIHVPCIHSGIVYIRSRPTEAFSRIHVPCIHAGIVYIRSRPIQKHLVGFMILVFMQVQFISDIDLQKHLQQHSCFLYVCMQEQFI